MEIQLILKLDSRLGKKYHEDITRLHNGLYANQREKLVELTGRISFGYIDSVDEVWQSGDAIAIAIDDDRPVGFITFKLVGKNNERWVNVLNFYVESAQRGKGVGLQLMDAVKDYGKTKNCKWMALTVLDNNSQAIGMYEKFGFRTEYQDMVKEL